MFVKIMRYAASIFLWCIQLSIFVTGFLAITSTIYYFPWFEADTFGALLVLMYIIPVQLIVIFIEYAFFHKNKLTKLFCASSVINLIAIVLIVILTFVNNDFFYKLAYLYGAIELALIAFLLLISLKLLLERRMKNNIKNLNGR
jgi:hypothetical protein